MSENLVQLYTTQFSTNLELKLQQMGSKLRGKVMEGSHVGKQASPVQYMNPVKFKSPAGRFAAKERTDTSFERRWVFPIDKELDQLIDSFDELKTIVDPKSQYSTNAAMGAAREWDDAIIASAFATAKIGQDAGGLTDETFNTGLYQIVSNFGSSAASGLTVAKIIEARRILRHNHVDIETDQVGLVVGSKQESDLLNQVQVVSTEFSERPVLVDGRVTRLLGFDITYSERLNFAANERSIIAYCKSGLYLGIWKDMNSRASQRNDLSGEPWGLYTSISFGATRLQAGKVLEIKCADTTGADIVP